MTGNSHSFPIEGRGSDSPFDDTLAARWAGYHDGQHNRPYPPEYERLRPVAQTTYEAARVLGVVVRRELGLRPWPREWTFGEFAASLRLSDSELDRLDADICEAFFQSSREAAVRAWQQAQISLKRSAH